MKIVHLTHEFSTNGGLGAYLLRLCPALADVGHENFVIHSDLSVSGTIQGVKTHYYIENFNNYRSEFKDSQGTAKVVTILQEIKPDIVHIQNNHNFLLESEIRKKYPAIKSLHVYDFCPSGNKFHHALQKPCEHRTSALCLGRLVYKRCLMSKRPWVLWEHYQRAVAANKNNAEYGKLIVATNYVKQQAIASGYPFEQIEVVPYFTPLPDLRDSTFDGKTILFTGRIVKEKGLEQLLHALSLVRTQWRLIVDGDGFELNKVKQLAQKLGLADRVEFVGWVDKENHWRNFLRASVVVVPSIWPEPFGLVGIEAMSYAKPVIAFKVGGISQWLEDKATGFLIEPYDVQAMAERIDYLLTHPLEAKQMGTNGRIKVEKEFIAKHHIGNLMNVYKKVLNEQTTYSASAI